MTLFQNNAVEKIFNAYPEHINHCMMTLRQLILDTAAETETVDSIEETLKWGEPSYLTKQGSTIRIAWKASNPMQYGIYFHCQTSLVDTFKILYKDRFHFEGNRAILFNDKESLPIDELKHCISLALTYHLRKNLPMLGT